MSKYLTAEQINNAVALCKDEPFTKASVIAITELLPAADVVEVKHGEWQITDAYPHNVYCSECHERFAQTHWVVWEDGSLPRNFCPNCGADMRERAKFNE